MTPQHRTDRFLRVFCSALVGAALIAAAWMLPAKAGNPGDLVRTATYSRYVAITKSDTTTYGRYAATQSEDIDAVYVGGGGDLALAGSDGVAVTFTAVPTGTVLQVSPTKIMSTNTTATAIAALYR